MRAGLAGVFDRAGTERRLGGVDWLIFFTAFMALGAILKLGYLGAFGIVFLILYTATVVAGRRIMRTAASRECGFARCRHSCRTRRS